MGALSTKNEVWLEVANGARLPRESNSLLKSTKWVFEELLDFSG
jgi:hypothetical protein